MPIVCAFVRAALCDVTKGNDTSRIPQHNNQVLIPLPEMTNAREVKLFLGFKGEAVNAGLTSLTRCKGLCGSAFLRLLHRVGKQAFETGQKIPH